MSRMTISIAHWVVILPILRLKMSHTQPLFVVSIPARLNQVMLDHVKNAGELVVVERPLSIISAKSSSAYGTGDGVGYAQHINPLYAHRTDVVDSMLSPTDPHVEGGTPQTLTTPTHWVVVSTKAPAAVAYTR